MKQHLAVSAIGSDRTGMVHELTRIITECGGSIAESRMAALGSEFAMLLLVSGNWHALARIESELMRMAETDALSVHINRTKPHPGAPMFAVQMIINVPSKLQVAQLREEFMDFCDSLNLDAILEPVKS